KTYDWDFDDGSTSNSENPTHTYQQAVVQTFNVCLRVVDQNGCINQTCDNVSIDLLNTADIQNNNIAIFPNPNNGSFSLNIGQPEGDIQIVVTDASGKTVHTVNNQLSSTQYNLQLLNAATGVYVVHVTNGGSHSSHRVMVTK
ncbi:MAG: T9SS type A sorting domain-containing protein, partial [Bacteroidetes bacterium]|nr:T9SS type A sorting domain-containing protein [Bacteroidota bacterium]